MILNYNDYRNKVLGCWMGKNIGGTLGAPMEWKRQINDVTFYTQDLKGEPLPNDDLDLQLAWLCALEKHGFKVDSRVLGEYWLDCIDPHWVEYGFGKTNLRLGLMPPVSGWYGNIYKDSCGAFIRSEIWACISPGEPAIAAGYAYEDAIVDHADEGVYAEIFTAVIQSAAFVVSDTFKLIEMGLSAIPENCGVTRGVKTAIKAYKSGVDWKAAREAVLNEVPSIPENYIGKENSTFTGYDAPNNIGFTVIGWLYGEGDFGKSLCIAVNCGDDTDCTAATLGAILGIINGIDGIPDKWKEPIGFNIITCCLNRVDGIGPFSSDIYDLTDRVIRIGEQFLNHYKSDIVISREKETDLSSLDTEKLLDTHVLEILLKKSKYSYIYDYNKFRAELSYEGEPVIRNNSIKRMKLTVKSTSSPVQNILFIRWNLPEVFTVSPSRNGVISLYNTEQDIEIEIGSQELNENIYRCSVEIFLQGYHTVGYIPFVLVNGNFSCTPFRMQHINYPKI